MSQNVQSKSALPRALRPEMVRLNQLRLQLRTHVIAFRLRLFHFYVLRLNLKMLLCHAYEVAI